MTGESGKTADASTHAGASVDVTATSANESDTAATGATVFTQQRFGRRALLQRGVTLGLGAAFAGGLLAACGGDDDDDDATPTTATATATTTTGADSGTTPAAATPTTGTSASTSTVTSATPTTPATTAATAATGAATAPPPAPTATSSAAPTTTPDASAAPPAGQPRADLLRLLSWQAPVTLNPHLTFNGYDQGAAALVLEPLTTFDRNDRLQPVLVATIPSVENGDLAADGRSVTYRLLPDVVWSDGTPFTAEDVRATWAWLSDPATGAATSALYASITEVEVVDAQTVTLHFGAPNPGWFVPFASGFGGQVLPAHLLRDWQGERARDAPINTQPVGTGPFVVTAFTPGDAVQYVRNPRFRDADAPYFERAELLGGGDAAGAARALFASGETDWATNLQLEPELLENLAADSPQGVVVETPSSSVEVVVCNLADPRTLVDGVGSEPGTPHPILSDVRVRRALALASDRVTIAEQLYGRSGEATPNLLTAPERLVSPFTTMEYDLDAARTLLEDAGWLLPNGGTVRERDGAALELRFQTIANPVRQKTQEVLKQAWEEIGCAVELVAIPFATYYSYDPGNPDTHARFNADLELHTIWPPNPWPLDFLRSWYSGDPAQDIAQRSNDWSGRNIARWQDHEFNQLFDKARTELNADRQDQLAIAMNDRVVNEAVAIPLAQRVWIAGASSRLRGYTTSQWTPDLSGVATWWLAEDDD